MQILQWSTKQISMAKTGTSKGKWETTLPLPQPSKEAAKANSFSIFSTSLMNVGKTNNNGNISIFTKNGVMVHKREYVLIMCKEVPILIGVHD